MKKRLQLRLDRFAWILLVGIILSISLADGWMLSPCYCQSSGQGVFRETVPARVEKAIQELVKRTRQQLHVTAEIDANVDHLLKDLLSDSDLEITARETMRQLGRKALPHLVKRLHDPDVAIRREAAWQLHLLAVEERKQKQPAADLAVVFIRSLRDKDLEVRRTAANALVKLRVEEGVPEFERLLKDKEQDLQRLGAGGLIALGYVERVPPALLQQLYRSLAWLTANETTQRAMARLEEQTSLSGTKQTDLDRLVRRLALQGQKDETTLRAIRAIGLAALGRLVSYWLIYPDYGNPEMSPDFPRPEGKGSDFRLAALWAIGTVLEAHPVIRREMQEPLATVLQWAASDYSEEVSKEAKALLERYLQN